MVERNEKIIEVQSISFGYQREPLLYNVSLAIKRGELVGLLGPNGSGKSTLQRIISGLLVPQEGKVLLEGKALKAWGRRGVAQRIAVVPQELHMPFAFSVEHMVSLGRTPFLSFLGSLDSHDKEIIEEAMQASSVIDLRARTFNELSGGEQQRVMIAMALAQRPAVLLLDEPTSHLDIKYQVETLELVQRLNQERGMTVLAAMHDLNLAARYFPRLVLFQRGVVADGGPAEVLEEGLLSRVYGVHVQVGILRGAEHLSVLPPGKKQEDDKSRQEIARVLVMAGGGSGERMMRALADEKISFRVGALNIGDSDLTLALKLASSVVTEQPYAPLSEQALEQVREQLESIAYLIICPMPLGPGNIGLLKEALRAAQKGVSVLLLMDGDRSISCETVTGAKSREESESESEKKGGIEERDYTGGEGTRFVKALLEAGARIVESVSDAVAVVSGMSSAVP